MALTNPIVQYGALIFARDGFTFSGDMSSGLKAQVKYRVPWENTFLFVNALVNPINQLQAGTITYSLPYQLPKAIAATPLYVQSFEITPIGLRDDLTTSTVLPYQGMKPGEYFKYAAVTVGFEQIRFTFQQSDDNNLMQLDPANPIPFCEQSIKWATNHTTIKAYKMKYFSDNTPVNADLPIPTYMVDLVLKYPHVPFQPWQLGLANYINTVNQFPIFNCNIETLLFTSPETETQFSMLGSSVNAENSLTITLRFNPNNWNYHSRDDGTMARVTYQNNQPIYQMTDFRVFFYQLMGYLESTSNYDPSVDWSAAEFPD